MKSDGGSESRVLSLGLNLLLAVGSRKVKAEVRPDELPYGSFKLASNRFRFSSSFFAILANARDPLPITFFIFFISSAVRMCAANAAWLCVTLFFDCL